jgi:N-acetyl sugar amidotransferase
MNNNISRCNNCLNMSTRPRISFDERGWCNACIWMEEKKSIDWNSRESEFKEIIKNYKTNDNFDCIIPVSGGKDSSYVSYTLKHKYNLNPLCVTIRPPLSLEIGDKNLANFVRTGFDHVHVTPNEIIMKKMNQIGFKEMGFPYYGWLIAIYSATIKIAFNFNIPLIMYGEDGEVEYGGSLANKNKAIFDIEYLIKSYLEKGYDKVLSSNKIKNNDLYWFTLPNIDELKKTNIALTHWSYFEDWDPYRNYLVAKEKCGLQENEISNASTFTNFAQTDQALYALHMYMCFLKFGFGRATQDAGIEIRRGAMDRSQAINLVNLYDGEYPEDFIDIYLDYYEMNLNEFDEIIDKWTNKDLFFKENNRWKLKKQVF